jgi:Family of unknown function (DUF5681)
MKPNLPNHSVQPNRKRQRSNVSVATVVSNEEYRVGPGHPPKEFQFKPGQSGNPKGAKRKPSLALDLKAMLERALNEKVKLRRGEEEAIITKAAAGIEKLVNGFAEGDRHARRDLILLADKLGVDLTAGQPIDSALAAAFSATDEAIIADFLRRHGVEPQSHGNGMDAAFNANTRTPEEKCHDYVE